LKGSKPHLQLGVESEFQLIERQGTRPMPLADELARRFGNEKNVRPEGLLSTFEIVTSIQPDEHGVAEEPGMPACCAAGRC